jgi:hypothetical protein
MWKKARGRGLSVEDFSACSARERQRELFGTEGRDVVASGLRDSVAMLLLGTLFLSSSESRERSDCVWSESFDHSQHFHSSEY